MSTSFSIPTHTVVTETHYADRSDDHGELVWSRSWQLHPVEKKMEFSGNLIAIENPATGEGVIWLQLAPSVAVRTWDQGPSLTIERDGNGWRATCGNTTLNYEKIFLPYQGGVVGCTLALQRWQQERHPQRAGRDGLFLSNTWGDRSRADKLNEDFVRAEIDRAAAIGVEVVQLDDGWQTGRSMNTTNQGGVWNDFWSTQPDFWTLDPQRFPNGLAPLVQYAKLRGIQLGLWYAPDSSNECARWEKDAALLLDLWRKHGIAHFKLDAVKLLSPQCEERFRALLDRVQRESNNEILFDLDTTAEARLGFWGRPQGAAIFVENRYTDWGSYYPHHTLRTLWSLCGTIHPSRLRMEILNTSRNDAVYGNDPLRPSTYRADYLFASVMVSSPLGWFENSELSDDFASQLSEIVPLWKVHRDEWKNYCVLPFGQQPNGHAWSGLAFVDRTNDIRQLLVFREVTERSDTHLSLPLTVPQSRGWKRIAGTGEARWNHDSIHVQIPQPRSFLWLAQDASR